MPTIVTKTIKPGGGGDYTSLNSWESANRLNLVTGDKISRAECYSGGNLLTANLALSNAAWVTDSTHYIDIVAAAGEEHNGIWNTSKAYIQGFNINQGAITVTGKDLQLRKMQLQHLTLADNNTGAFNDTGTATTIIDRCIIRAAVAAGSILNGGGMVFSSTGTKTITSSFIMHYGGATNSHVYCVYSSAASTITVNNCTLIALNVLGAGKTAGGFRTNNASAVINSDDNYIKGTSCYLASAGTINKGAHDATSNADATTASLRNIAYTTANFLLVSPQQSEDLHLTGDSELKAKGTAISTFDIDGQSFASPPSIGGDEVFLGTRSAICGGYALGGVRGSGRAIVGGYATGTAQATPVNAPSGFIGGYALAAKSPPDGHIGGFAFAITLQNMNAVDIVGGYVKGREAFSRSSNIGGYIDSFFIQNVPIALIGGSLSGLYKKAFEIGGFAFGFPSGNHFVEDRTRTLVKAKSDEVSGQALDIDATMVLKGLTNDEFNAQIQIEDTSKAEFNAKVNIQKTKIPPTVVVKSITPSISKLVNGVRKVTVVASGNLVDGTEWKGAYIDFGEPFISTDPLIFSEGASISGFSGPPPWTTTHDYHASGIYVITARALDNFAMVGMDSKLLNLASGLTPGVQYPLISISGTPRSGQVPDPLLVTFSVANSGVGIIKSPGDPNILWSFGNKEFTQTKSPKTYYAAPGHYVAKLTWRYITSNGTPIYVSDGLTIGYNNA